MAVKQRLDSLLADRGIFESRARAAASILAGDVRLGGAGGDRARKPGQLVDPESEISITAPPPYVSRGGVKLANALDASGIDPSGALALDVGASTGGFTDCLLQRGAARVIALDVAYGELSWRIRNDPRVITIERQNARHLTPQLLPFAPDLITIDASFISLKKILPAVLATAAPRYQALALVKPQFEVGRERVAKGGVVREPAHRLDALVGAGEAARGLGASVLGFHSSGLPGPKGNRETFLFLAEGGRDGAARDRDGVLAMAREVERDAA